MYFHYENIVYFQEINISERFRGGGAKNNLLLLPLKAEIWRTFCRFAGSPLAGEIPQCGAIHASSGASGRENCRIWYLGVGGAVGGYVSGGRAAAAAGAGAGDILVSEKTNKRQGLRQLANAATAKFPGDPSRSSIPPPPKKKPQR